MSVYACVRVRACARARASQDLTIDDNSQNIIPAPVSTRIVYMFLYVRCVCVCAVYMLHVCAHVYALVCLCVCVCGYVVYVHADKRFCIVFHIRDEAAIILALVFIVN